MNKRLAAIAIVVAAVAAAAGLFASSSNSAPSAQRTIGLITDTGAQGFFDSFDAGGKSAATALGDRLAITQVADPWATSDTIRSLVARRVAAIVFHPDPAALTQLRPALARAHAAGIPTLSYELDSPGSSVWVSQTSPAQFMHALADALASQMNQQGQF